MFIIKISSNSQIKIGIILSYLNQGIGNLIPLFYTPVMLSLLGQNEFGLYKMASSTTSYLSLMAFGIGGAVTRYLIKANTDGGKEYEESVFGLFNLIFKGIAFLTLIVGGVLALNLDVFYSEALKSDELIKMKIIVGIMVINTAIGFSATSYNSVVSSHERFVFLQITNILSTVLAPISNLIILFMGYKSIGMAISSLFLSVIVRILYIIYVRKILCIRPKYKNLPINLIKEIFVFSFWIFISNICSQLFSATDTVIIGMVPKLATVGVAVYSIGHTFPNILFGLAQATPNLFMPRANKMVFKGCSDAELTDLVIKVGRIQCYIVSLVCFGFIAFGMPFIYFYAGPEYSESYWVAVIMMIPNCIPLVQSACNSVMQAKNMHSFRAKMYIFISIGNAVLTYFLVGKYGVIGAAIPTGLCYIIGNGLVLNWFFWKKMHLDIPLFWRNMLPIYGLSTIMCIITLFISNWINFYDIKLLLIGIIVFTLIYLILAWLLILNDYEKDIFKQPVKRFLKKLKFKREKI